MPPLPFRSRVATLLRVKAIELLVRSDEWNPSIRRAFFAHLDKPMKDDARLGYCDRKAWFLARGSDPRKHAAAIALLDWALAAFTHAGDEALRNARATRGELRRTQARK